MNNDRELLELAAKAAGIVLGGETNTGFAIQIPVKPYVATWNPLVDDGDAFRLAVKLKMNVYPGEAYPWDTSVADYSHKFSAVCDEDEDPNSYSATRRAIVRAAAEIGKAMP